MSGNVTSRLKFNKKFNRYESDIDHHYAPFNYNAFQYDWVKPYKGKIKCRLVHALGSSVIVPEYVFFNNNTWLQPLHFIAPILAKLDEDLILTDIFIDVAGGKTVKVRFMNDGLLNILDDNSQLYDCEIYGPSDIESYASGDYQVINEMIYLKLFHHTNENGYLGIMNTKLLWPSKWNYRGNKECVEFNFVYFTHIPELKYPSDLATVAMSAEGTIDYMVDSFTQPAAIDKNFREKYKDSIYSANVYRATTKDRNYVIPFFIPVAAIDVKHVYKHLQNGRVFYEICFPYIHRLKVTLGSKIPFTDNKVIEESRLIVHSEYCIIGDARTTDGLAAPFEEEETQFIFKIEDCGGKSIPEFWFGNSNTDLYTNKVISTMTMIEVDNNPTK